MLNIILTKNGKGVSSPFGLFSIILLIIFGFSNMPVTAQTFVGDAFLTTQIEVDAFNYTEVTGYLLIQESVQGSITNLDGLSNLTTVGGLGLYIQSNSALTNIDGLSSLNSVVHVHIKNNSALTNLNGLSGLTSTEGFLGIIDNLVLTSLDGLSNLTSIGNNLIIYNNSALTNLDGLSGLTHIEGSLDIDLNPALTNIDGLSSLTFVGFGLFINENPVLTNLDGLSSLTFLGFHLNIFSNPALTEYCGLYTLLSGGFAGGYIVSGNAVNPTQAEIIAGGPCVPLVVVCPLPQGDWKNNPEWHVDDLMLGTQTYSQLNLVNILIMPVGTGNKADASLILAKQLIAAKLNIENGADASEDVQDSVDSADGLIGSNTIPMNVQPKTPLGKQMTAIAGFLESYNKGELNEGCTLAKSGNTEIVELNQVMPIEYVLSQNYPNPFNPATTISWQLPVSSHVSLKVYDILGKEVASLVNENREAGYYEVSFDASALTTGVYIYRLTAGNYISTKKMLLIK
jgi:hypothetical protein